MKRKTTAWTEVSKDMGFWGMIFVCPILAGFVFYQGFTLFHTDLRIPRLPAILASAIGVGLLLRIAFAEAFPDRSGDLSALHALSYLTLGLGATACAMYVAFQDYKIYHAADPLILVGMTVFFGACGLGAFVGSQLGLLFVVERMTMRTTPPAIPQSSNAPPPESSS